MINKVSIKLLELTLKPDNMTKLKAIKFIAKKNISWLWVKLSELSSVRKTKQNRLTLVLNFAFCDNKKSSFCKNQKVSRLDLH